MPVGLNVLQIQELLIVASLLDHTNYSEDNYEEVNLREFPAMFNICQQPYTSEITTPTVPHFHTNLTQFIMTQCGHPVQREECPGYKWLKEL